MESSPLMDADRNRIFDDLDAILANMTANETVTVVTTLTSDVPLDFMTELARILGPFPTNYLYDHPRGLSSNLTRSQVELLAGISWVRQIEQNYKVSTLLNTATKWDGVVKARLDFGVDGDRDGSPGGYSAGDVVIAVMDTGIDTSHVDLDGGKVIGWKDLVNNQPNPYDDQGHGTYVASIASGEGHGDPAYTGVAPRTALVGVEVMDWLGGGSMDRAVAGVNWVIDNRATYGIEILSMSIGQSGQWDGTDALSQAVNAASNAGIVVVVAAGNDGPRLGSVSSPAAATGAIAVGAMADPGAGGYLLWWSSSRGPTLDGRIKPNIAAPGHLITAAQRGGGYRTESGTSAAAPFVSGVVALMLDANPTMTPSQIRTTLESYAEDWGTPPSNNDYGSGRLRSYQSVGAAKGSAGNPPGVPAHGGAYRILIGNGAALVGLHPMTDVSTPFAATLLQDKTCIGMDLHFNGQHIAGSHGNDRQDTIGVSVGSRGLYQLTIKDDSWFMDCGARVDFDTSFRSDDWGSFGDAQGSFGSAMVVSPSSDRGGFLNGVNGVDSYDWYQTSVTAGCQIQVSMTPLQSRNFDLQLYDPSGVLRATSSNGAGQTENIAYTASVSGNWRFVAYYPGGGSGFDRFGVYSISLALACGGGGGCVSEGTPILTRDGYVPVEKLKLGEIVMGYDLSEGKLIELTAISLDKSQESALVSINNGTLVITQVNQPIYMKNDTHTGWLRDPRNLTIGDFIFDAVNNQWVEVWSLEFLHIKTKVFDIITDGPNNFIANGFLLDKK